VRPPSALKPYANTRILLFTNAIPGVLDSERTVNRHRKLSAGPVFIVG
jgi:hypothetical protein